MLNADKSEVMLVENSSQLKAASSVTTVTVAGVRVCHVSTATKSLGVIIDSRLTFDDHVTPSAMPVIFMLGHFATYANILHFGLHKHSHAALWDHVLTTVMQCYMKPQIIHRQTT